MKDVLDRHEKVVLMLSGGKDSVACLYLLKEFLHKITVMWVNTGDAFPETERLIRNLVKDVPSFLEIKSNVSEFKEKVGNPTDLLPTRNSFLNVTVQGLDIPMFVSHIDCCSYNLWYPALSAIKEMGATLIIRGQRNDEDEKSIVRSGDVKEGIEYFFPIEGWTKENVIDYLNSVGFESPEHFKFDATSLDCLHCTAFLKSHHDRMGYMKENHPIAFLKNKNIISMIMDSAEKEFDNLREYANG